MFVIYEHLLQYFNILVGFQLYVMLIEVFEAEKSRIRWYYFIAYGLPLFITFISAAVYPQGYGTERHCWLQTDNYFIYSFVGPVIVVISVSSFKMFYFILSQNKALYFVQIFHCSFWFLVESRFSWNGYSDDVQTC